MALSLLDSIQLEENKDKVFNYEALSNIKKMIYLVQQFLLTDYTIMFTGSLIQEKPKSDNFTQTTGDLKYKIAAPLLLREYRKKLLERAFVIPKTDFNTGKYVYYHEAMDAIATGTMPTADTLIDMFMDNEVNDGNELDYNFNIPYQFLIPFIHSVNGTSIDPERLEDQAIYNEANSVNAYKGFEFINPIFYIPTFCNSKETHLRLILQLPNDIAFPLYKVKDFNILRSELSLPYRYLASMDWRGKQFSQTLGVLEQFSIEHDAHVMQNDHVCTVGDICHDVVTGSDYCQCCKPSNISDFISFCKHLHDTWGVSVDESRFLGEILKHTEYTDPNLINYLQKSDDEVTVAELEAFKTSRFFGIVDKTIIATEADDPNKDKKEDDKDTDAQAGDETPEGDLDADAPADEAGDGGAITDDTATDTNDVGGGDLGDDIDNLGSPDAGGDGTGENTEEEKEDTPIKQVERKIPPAIDGILLELLNPENETLADHLYRKEFLIRVNDILQQPNPRYSSKTLFMLKEWATKWLYIFSVASLKSFLKNIHFSGMNKQ